MASVFINLLFIELVILLGVHTFFKTVELYKRSFPHEERSNEYVDDSYDSVTEEVYDEGYINEANEYEARICEIKNSLKVNKEPSVEIITDEYERSLE